MRIQAVLKKAVKAVKAVKDTYRKQTERCNMVGVYDRLDHFDFIVVICMLFSVHAFSYC